MHPRHVATLPLFKSIMRLRTERRVRTRPGSRMTQPKQPPPGVETAPQGPVVSLQEAATRLGKDPRTVIRAIKAGEIRGGAVPRPERLRWYVYADALPGDTPAAPAAAADRVAEDLRAQIVSLS